MSAEQFDEKALSVPELTPQQLEDLDVTIYDVLRYVFDRGADEALNETGELVDAVTAWLSRAGLASTPPDERQTCVWMEPHVRELDARLSDGCGWRTLHRFEPNSPPGSTT